MEVEVEVQAQAEEAVVADVQLKKDAIKLPIAEPEGESVSEPSQRQRRD